MAVVPAQSVYKRRVGSAVIKSRLVRRRHMVQHIAALPVQHHLSAAGKRKHGVGMTVKHRRKRAKACPVRKPVITEHNLDVFALRHFYRGIPVKDMPERLLIMPVFYLWIALLHQGFCRVICRVIRQVHLKVRIILTIYGFQQAFHLVRIIIAGNTYRNLYTHILTPFPFAHSAAPVPP